MVGNPRARRVPVAGDDIEHTRREAHLERQLGDPQRRQRCQLRGLHHHRVACGQRRTELPAGEHQREVPRHDLANHADRLALDVVQEARIHRQNIALQLVGHAAEVAEAEHRARHVQTARIHDRVTGVQRFERDEFLSPGFDRVRQLEHERAPVVRCHFRPRREGRLGRSNGAVDVFFGGLGDGRDLGGVEGIEHVDGLALDPVDPLAADHQPRRSLVCFSHGFALQPGGQLKSVESQGDAGGGVRGPGRTCARLLVLRSPDQN